VLRNEGSETNLEIKKSPIERLGFFVSYYKSIPIRDKLSQFFFVGFPIT